MRAELSVSFTLTKCWKKFRIKWVRIEDDIHKKPYHYQFFDIFSVGFGFMLIIIIKTTRKSDQLANNDTNSELTEFRIILNIGFPN